MTFDFLSSTRATSASLAALALAALIFVASPVLDLHVAAWFALGGTRFTGQTHAGNLLRHVFYAVPFVLLTGFVALYLAKRFGHYAGWAPTSVGLAFMVASMALGPGLLVNVILKDHAHRPRPYQVTEFGGDEAFRPFYRFDGACRRNCSFVSGEGSDAFWTVAPALLVPLPWRPMAVGAALVFGVATSLLRLAFGGHFLSDTVFAALLTWLVILACWRATGRLTGTNPRDEARPS